jgi:hypothetical protein
VSTNDSSATNLRLNFSAEVVDFPDSSFALNITPTQLDFTPAEGEKKTKISAQIQNVGKNRVKIEPVGYPGDLFKVGLSDSDLKPGEKSKLMVKLNRKVELEKFEKSITLELNDKGKTRFTIPVRKKPPAPEKSLRKPPIPKPQGG